MSTTFLLLLLLGTAFAATHVNISIAQHPLTNAAGEVSYVDSKSSSSAQLRASPSDKSHQSDVSYHSEGGQERAAKLQEPSKNTNLKSSDDNAELRRLNMGSHDSVFYNNGRPARVQQFGKQEGQSTFSEKGAGNNHRQGYSKVEQHQRQPQSQFRQPSSEREKQNQEFERYIQNYHGGPTVETVYESSNPSPQLHQQSSSSSSSSSAPQRVVAINSRPAQMHKFERLVDLPTATPTLLPVAEDAQTHTKPSTVTHQTSSSSSSASSTTISSSFDSSLAAGGGKDQPSFDQATTYTKPNFVLTNYAPANEKPNLELPTNYAPSNNKPNYDQSTIYNKPSFDPTIYAPTADKPNFDQSTTYNKPSFEPTNYAPSISKPNFDQAPGYNKPSFDQTNYAAGNDQAPGYNKPSFDQTNYAAGNDQQNFDQTPSYNKPNYDQHNNKYDGGAQETDFFNQYPPSVNEPRGGYYGGYYGSNDGSGYYGAGPANTYAQRPVVTKTIQIAQPALKAKKYEIRHPAIQKEFYDIEERVLIKPAGTIVVELDHPVSKIARGETILPLGHVHPAVAAAYHTNGPGLAQAPASSAGSYSSSSSTDHGNQYSPSPVYNPTKPVYEEQHHHHNPVIGGTTIASAIATTPSNDPSLKGNFVEANLSKQFSGGEPQFVTTTEQSYNQEKQNNNDYYLATDPHGNQHQIASKYLTPNMVSKDEPDFARQVPNVDVKNNGAPGVASSSSNQQNYNAQASSAPVQPLFRPNNNNNQQYNGEFFGAEYYNNPNQHQQNAKPAHLQEQQDFKSARLQEQPSQNVALKTSDLQTHVIRLPPVQHNIYLDRLQQDPAYAEQQPQQQQQSAQLKSARYEDEVARVLEIKPYLQQHKGSVVVYASPVRPSQHQSQRYTQPEQSRPHFEQYRDQFRNAADDTNRVHYSAPYSNMRYHPEESSRLTRPNFQHDSNKKADLILENKEDSSEETSSVEFKEDSSKMRPHTHIQIQIPQHPQEADKPVVVSSTIHPPMNHERPANYRLSLSSSFSSYAEPSEAEKVNLEQSFNRADQEPRSANLESKPDCDQSLNAHYENVPQNYEHDVQGHSRGQQKFMRLIEQPSSNASDKTDSAASPAAAAAAANIQADEVDVNVKSVAGHVATPGSRVIAATAAPTGATAGSESFHKRRIVVNHPFQTVREVVEHEPYTNYHQVQVNEPMHAQYYQETHYQPTHGSLRQVQTGGVPVYYQ